MFLSCCVIIVALAAGLADAVYYGSGTVGASCTFNTDCITQATMYCNVGACACYSNYVSYQGYCYASINPGTSGCAYDFQCSAVWPGATCTGATGGGATDGTCRCPAPDYIEKTTRDGTVCVKLTDAFGAPVPIGCPLPENGGFLTVLNGDPLSIPPVILCTPNSIVPASTTGLCTYVSSDGLTTISVDDLYDCIEAQPGLGINGVCCPDRAFTCIQPLLPPSSTSATAETRYWYNSITGACQAFLYDAFDTTPLQTSPNNFRTIEQCQSYCGQTCDRGAPDYDLSTTGDVRNDVPETCTYTTDCQDTTNYACQLVSSVSYCCPTASFNCGPYGGLVATNVLSGLLQTLPNVGFASASQPSATRYYYDSTTSTCRTFTYQGNGGNFNNFLSASDCINYCQTICTQGFPLKDAVGNTLSCSTTTSCPSTHTCTSGYCCPKPRFVCQQTKQPGDGSSSTNIRYWWNQYTRQCEQFYYTGQNGNDNNFVSLTTCQSYCASIRIAPQCEQGAALVDFSDQYVQCGTTTTSACGTNYACIFDGYVYGCCPTKAYVCGITSNSGVVCNGPASTRYYFNSITQTCTSFSFNGCDGNPNNFRDITTCNNYCGAGGCPYGGTPYQATSSSAFQTCTTSADCVGNYECDTVTLGSTVNNYCCPSRSYVCQQSVYSGANCGSASVNKWVYRYTTGVCEQFTFTGCAGTANNFATQLQCQTFCGSSACLAGEVAKTNGFGGSLTCTSDATCGTGYKCRFDSLTSTSYCCGSDASGVCNSDQRAYIDPTSGAAAQCTPSLLAGACYTGFNCQLNTVLGKYYCCTSLNGTVCPTNRAPYQINGVPQSCSLSSTGTCLNGYSCQSPAGVSYISYTGYCCTSNDVCPSGGTYYIQTAGTTVGNALACTVGGTACPSGYYCAALTGLTTGYCCTGGSTALNGGCPTGQFVQVTATTPTVTYAQCNPFNGQLNGGCSSSLYPSCQWSVPSQMYVCCGTTAVTTPTNTGGCPGNQVALFSGSTVVTCTSSAQCTSVQAGYFCQYSTVNSRLQCCAVQGTCTGTSVAFVDTNGNTVACSSNAQCTVFGAYQCLGGNCCTGGTTGGCTANQVLFNGQCLATGLLIGQACSTSPQCTGSAGAQCIGGFCSCPTGTINSGNQCVTGSQIGQACTTTSQCQGGSTCVGGICTCPAGQTNQAGVCRTSSSNAPTCKTVGQTAAMVNGAAVNCLTTACSAGFLCEWNSLYNGGQYICCGGGTSSTSRCPSSTEVEQPSRAFCLNAACTAGYTCKYSTLASNYVCCAPATSVPSNNPSTSSRCPTGQVEQTGDSTCLTKSCANGYSCSYSAAAATYICCVSSTSVFANAANPSSSSMCSGSYLMYYNSNVGVRCNVDNDCVGTQYPKCLKSNTAGYTVCCANGGTQSYGK